MNLTISTENVELNAAPPSQVVVIEDDPVVRRLLRRFLYRAGLDVIDFPTGDEGVRYLARCEAPVALIVTDGIMPGMDGFAVARWCAENMPDTRLILLSGYLHHFVAQSDIPENIEAFFTKPFSANQLVAKVLDLTKAVA